MSDPTAPPINPVAYIRTIVPVLVGSLIAWLISNVPVVADSIRNIEAVFGQGWRDLAVTAATALIIAGYYWLARQIGRRFPGAEKFLLGSSATPVYVK